MPPLSGIVCAHLSLHLFVLALVFARPHLLLPLFALVHTHLSAATTPAAAVGSDSGVATAAAAALMQLLPLSLQLLLLSLRVHVLLLAGEPPGSYAPILCPPSVLSVVKSL
jgi:hypothetical protein